MTLFRLGVFLVLATHAYVTSGTKICICTVDLNPVCGSDGRTYNNMCLLQCQQRSDQNLKLDKHGHCQSVSQGEKDNTDCICSSEYEPVCASDGRTYQNLCFMRCKGKNIVAVHNGECRQKRKCTCTLEYVPVCGTDGKTYSNQCELDCQQNVRLAYRGVCRNKREMDKESLCICTLESKPVCGNNGVTYSNLCSLKCEKGKVKLAYPGECRTKREINHTLKRSSCFCGRNIDEVCGTDGQTYPNDCLLICAKQKNKDLEVDHDGPCEESLKIKNLTKGSKVISM